MDRIHFITRTVLGSLFLFILGSPEAGADDDGFTMSSGALLGGANGTQGA